MKTVCRWRVHNSRLLICGAVGFSLVLASLATTEVEAAVVESLSSDVLIQEDANVYWQATVKCEGNTRSFQIKQERQQQGWCSETTLLPCQPTKLEMASQVCLNIDVLENDNSSNAITTPEQESTPSVAPPAPQEQSGQEAAQKREAARRQRDQRAAEIRTDEQALQVERRRLDAEKQAVAQASRQLKLEEEQLEAQLRALEN